METPFSDRTLYLDPTRVAEVQRALRLDEAGAEPGQPVPLGFFMYVTTIGVEDVNAATGFDPFRTVYGGTELTSSGNLNVGETVTVRSGIARRWEKETKAGPLRFAEIACDYLRDEALVVCERTTVVERP